MKVVVEVLPAARHELLGLLESRCATKLAAVEFGRVYLADIEQQLIEHDGIPPDVRKSRDGDGALWWWRYTNGIWAVYRITDVKGWFSGVRTVTIRSFEVALPAA